MLSHALSVGSVCNHQQRESHTLTFPFSLLLTCACTSTEPQRARTGRGLLRGFLSRSSGYEQYVACYGGFYLCFLSAKIWCFFSAERWFFFPKSFYWLGQGLDSSGSACTGELLISGLSIDTLLTVRAAERRSKDVIVMESSLDQTLTHCTIREVGKIGCGLLK